MQNLTNGDVPLGLGMALAQNMTAMAYFSSLDAQQQQAIIEHTHQIRSKQEMQAYVNSLVQKPHS